jgi:acetyltransferase-like isoleucine patch superfamily enzyme
LTWRDLRRGLRLLSLAFVAVAPSFVKRPIYRLLFGYRIGKRAKIGISLLDAKSVDLADDVSIGHFNIVFRVSRFEMATKAHIGTLNIIRGGERVSLGRYSTVMRMNVLNAIPDHDCTTNPESVLELRDAAIVVSNHWIDFTDRVTIGRNVILGGRNSSLWTHNRQLTAPISIGDFCYLGSEVRVAPGAGLAAECILALGSVLSGQIGPGRSLVGGVPARVVRPLSEEDLAHVHRKTRKDIPDDLLI